MQAEAKQVLNNINWRNIFNKLGTLLGLVILMIILSIATPYFFTVKNLMNVAQQSAINALVSAGMLLTILSAGIDLSVGSVLALSICVTGLAINNFHVNPVVGFIFGIACGALFGLVNGLLLTKLHLPHPFISTMGTQNIARGLALFITGASPISGFPNWIQFIGAGYIWGIPFSFLLVAVMVVVFHIFLTRTTLGRQIYAVGGNKEAARLSGINTDRVLIWIYAISGLMAAIAGMVLLGRVNAAYPLAGLQYESDAIAAVIIGGASFMGGIGTIWGTLIGAMIIAVIRNGLNLLGVAPDMQTVVVGAVIIGAVFIDVLRRRGNKR
ncbi:MAG TPA: sugar ABC transporter permease [Firmicutes bacterium]|jgi:ribose transport system permease protein|nr:sugar ABC transporter permease [Bacillota bacterium]